MGILGFIILFGLMLLAVIMGEVISYRIIEKAKAKKEDEDWKKILTSLLSGQGQQQAT